MAIAVKGMAPLLQVFDMPAALAFYRDKLGFEVVQSNAPGDDCDWAMLKLGDEVLMLNTAYEKEFRPPAPDPRPSGSAGSGCAASPASRARPAHAKTPGHESVPASDWLERCARRHAAVRGAAA